VISDHSLVVVATYNERENIEALVTQIPDNAGGCRVLVIDDSSPDGTGECAHRMASQDKRIELLERPAKLGPRSAYLAGFRHALAHDFDRVITMDADFSHHPRHLPAILACPGEPGVDMVIGCRYIKDGGVSAGRSGAGSSASAPTPLPVRC
jgi:dolichol-phosphate mannosyltransferase